jgi:restriction system protein
MWHDGLKKHRLIKGNDPTVVNRKADVQAADWEERWAQVVTRSAASQDRASKREHQENYRRIAAERTQEAEDEQAKLSAILRYTLSVDDRVDWERLKDRTNFPEPRPTPPPAPPAPAPRPIDPEPTLHFAQYQPRLSFLDRLIPGRRAAIEAACQARLRVDHDKWEDRVEEATAALVEARRAHGVALARHERVWAEANAAWEARQAAFLTAQRTNNEAIENQRLAYQAGKPEVIAEYCDMVLSASTYPDYFPKEFELDYVAETKILIVDYVLPPPDALPTLRDVKYVASRDELTEQHVSEGQRAKTYDSVLYQVALRSIHELFEADVISALAAIVFNGIVTSIDRGTGNPVTACVMSLHAERDEFVAIDLSNVDPKTCFKSLKGVGSSKLHSLAAVAPVMEMRRDDARFVAPYAVVDSIQEGDNLAAIDWEDFEHLVREVFAKEFSSAGGEVKITRASRDGGVDAVAFDPDPIRGGKTVIQAKRYTHTVGVSAVRDLYGTVLNEGANRGILVTTSDYGPDAYAFATGKPLVLMSGSNLLHLLSKHGHKARIDLQEARRLNASRAGDAPT